MHLIRLRLSADGISPPRAVRAFLREADRRIERFRRDRHVPGFVPSDYAKAYAVLRALAAGDRAPGRLFCEWSSGFGVVACLAAMLDFDASGIEIEADLVDAARQLAEDFGLPVAFACGSRGSAPGDPRPSPGPHAAEPGPLRPPAHPRPGRGRPGSAAGRGGSPRPAWR